MIKKSKYIFLIITVFLLTTNIVKAESCDAADIERLKQIANNVEISYELKKDKRNDKRDYFDLSFSNLNHEIYFIKSLYKYYDFKDGEIYHIKQDYNNNYVGVTFYSVLCEVELLTKEISLPEYNYYYESDECKNVPKGTLSVCDKWYSKKITEDQFRSIIEDYNNDISTFEKFYNIVINFVLKYFWYIFFGIFLLLLTIIILIIVIKRERSRLE